MARKQSGPMFLGVLILLMFCYIQPNRSIEFSIGDITDLLRYGRTTLIELFESWDLISERLPGEDDTFPFVKKMERVLKRRITEVSQKLDMYQLRTEAKTQRVLEQLMTHLPTQLIMRENFRDFDLYVGQINDLYDVFAKYASAPETYETYTLENFAKASVSPGLGALPDVLKTLHRLVVPTQSQLFNNSILVMFAKEMKVGPQEIRYGFLYDDECVNYRDKRSDNLRSKNDGSTVIIEMHSGIANSKIVSQVYSVPLLFYINKELIASRRT